MIKPTLTRKKIVIGTVVGILLIIFAVGWLLLSVLTKTDKPEVSEQTVDESHLAAVARADEGDIDGALEQYDEAIGKYSDDEDTRKTLLLRKANLASQSGRAEVAIDAAKQAEAIEPDTTTAQILAAAYEQKGDNENAVIYYKKLIELTPEGSPGSRYIYIWKMKIEELQQ